MCRRFTLVRDQHDGVNQPGVVAEGVLFAVGKVALYWVQPPRSVALFDTLADVLLVQNRNGVTRLVWVDGREEDKLTPPPPAGRYGLQAAKDSLAVMLGEDHILVSAESRSTQMTFARGMRTQ